MNVERFFTIEVHQDSRDAGGEGILRYDLFLAQKEIHSSKVQLICLGSF